MFFKKLYACFRAVAELILNFIGVKASSLFEWQGKYSGLYSLYTQKIYPVITLISGFHVICITLSNFCAKGYVVISLILYCSHS